MNLKRSLNLLVVGVLSIGFVGCGGGGGSSTSTGDSVVFPSNAVSATPTLSNGKKVKGAVNDNPTSVTSSVLNGVDDTSGVNIALLSSTLSSEIVIITKNINLQTYTLNEVVDQTTNCSGGGSIHYRGNGNDTAGGTITANFNNCSENSVKMNGTMVYTISNYDSNSGNFKSYAIKFPADFVESTGSTTIKIYKGTYINVDILEFGSYDNPTKLKESISMIVANGTQQYGIKDAVYYADSSYSGISLYQTQGKIYIDNLSSYVDYDTNYDMSQTPFVYDSYGLQSGEAHYNMANNGKIKIVVQSGVAKAYVDVDNDGIYELHE